MPFGIILVFETECPKLQYNFMASIASLLRVTDDPLYERVQYGHVLTDYCFHCSERYPFYDQLDNC